MVGGPDGLAATRAAAGAMPAVVDDLVGGYTTADRPCVHSALLALHGRSDLMTSRIWEGQLMVLLPFLERKRQILLARYKDDLLQLLSYIKLPGPNRTVEM